MRYCPKCGAENRDEAKYCAKCGEEFRESFNQVSDDEKHKIKYRFIWSLILVLVVSLITKFAVCRNDPSNKKEMDSGTEVLQDEGKISSVFADERGVPLSSSISETETDNNSGNLDSIYSSDILESVLKSDMPEPVDNSSVSEFVLGEGFYYGTNDTIQMHLSAIKDNEDHLHLSIEYRDSLENIDGLVQFTWDEYQRGFVVEKPEMISASVAMESYGEGKVAVSLFVKDKYIFAEVEKKNWLNVTNTILAVKEYFRQGAYSTMDDSLDYEFPVTGLEDGWYSEMFMIPVCYENEALYYALVANDQFEEPGRAIIISAETMDALRDSDEVIADDKILEEFNVCDFYDIDVE